MHIYAIINTINGKHYIGQTTYKYVKSNSKMGKKNPFYGKKHSKETIIRLSDANKGKIPWNKGKRGVYSEEMLEKMRVAKKGKYNRGHEHVSI